MKWYEVIGIIFGFVSNMNINDFFKNINFNYVLNLYINNNESISKIFSIYISLLIKVISGINVYNIESCLRLFGL